MHGQTTAGRSATSTGSHIGERTRGVRLRRILTNGTGGMDRMSSAKGVDDEQHERHSQRAPAYDVSGFFWRAVLLHHGTLVAGPDTPISCSCGSLRDARPVPPDRVRVDVRVAPQHRLHLALREHLGLIAVKGRVVAWTLAVCVHRVRVRLVTELDGENPPVPAYRLALAVRIILVPEHAEAPDVAVAPAHRHVHVPDAHAMHVAPGDVGAPVAPHGFVDRPRERVHG